MVPKDLQDFFCFCAAWLIAISAGIFFAIMDLERYDKRK